MKSSALSQGRGGNAPAEDLLRVNCSRCQLETMIPGDDKFAFRDLLLAKGWRVVGSQWLCPACLKPKQWKLLNPPR